MLLHRRQHQQQSMDIIRQICMQLQHSWPRTLPRILIALIIFRIPMRRARRHRRQQERQPAQRERRQRPLPLPLMHASATRPIQEPTYISPTMFTTRQVHPNRPTSPTGILQPIRRRARRSIRTIIFIPIHLLAFSIKSMLSCRHHSPATTIIHRHRTINVLFVLLVCVRVCVSFFFVVVFSSWSRSALWMVSKIVCVYFVSGR